MKLGVPVRQARVAGAEGACDVAATPGVIDFPDRKFPCARDRLKCPKRQAGSQTLHERSRPAQIEIGIARHTKFFERVDWRYVLKHRSPRQDDLGDRDGCN